MNLKFWKKDEPEKRSAGEGYTSAILAARESWISGQSGLAELTATVQSTVSLWEHCLSISDVSGTDLMTPAMLGITARSLALKGESVWYVAPHGLVPVSDWDLSTQGGVPRAYRISVPEAGGGTTQTVLAAEILHFRIGSDAYSPWSGTSPLARANLTASTLHAVESALAEIFEFAPLASQIVSFPESNAVDLEKMGHSFRGRRGRVLLQESVNVHAAGGAVPTSDWSPKDLSPDLQKSMTIESLEASRNSILSVFGVLPSLFNPSTTGPQTREAQRHLCQFMLTPICKLIAHEASQKLATTVTLNCLEPLQAFDLGQRTRSLAAIISALAEAKAAGIDPVKALDLVNLEQG